MEENTTDSDSLRQTENVVIVPECILQAFKSTSSVEKDCTQLILSPDYKYRLSEPGENDVDLNQNHAGNMWLSLPVDVLGQEITGFDSSSEGTQSKLVNVILPNSALANHADLNEMEDGQRPCTSDVQIDTEMPLLQNVCFLPNSNSSFVIENIESDGENNIYTFAPVKNSNLSQVLLQPKRQESCKQDPDLKGNKRTADKGTHTDGPKPPHRCSYPLCNKSFPNAAALNKHKVTVHEEKKVYRCHIPGCPWSFQTPYKLKRHLESHAKLKPYACTYKGCNHVFSNSYNLATHMKVHTELNADLLCQHCGLVATGKRKLELHMRKEHNEGPSLLCTICNQKFHTMPALVIHKRSHDPNKPNHSCPLCDQKFSKRCELKMHLYKHTGERPFQCDQCEWTFTSLSRLNRHLRTHKEKRYTCSVDDCGKQFHRMEHLATHMKTHTGNLVQNGENLQQLCSAVAGKDMEFYNCDICGFSFLSRHGLTRHKLKCMKGNPSDKPTASKKDNSLSKSKTTESPHEKNSEEGRSVMLNGKLQPSNQTCPEITTVDNEVVITSQEACDQTEQEMQSNLNIPERDTNIAELDNSWPASLLTGTNSEIDTNEYLSQDEVGSVPLAPFIDDMVVLSAANTPQFLHLNEDLGPGMTEDVNNSDVLCQYVVDSARLRSNHQNDIEIGNGQFKDTRNSQEGQSSGLFEVTTMSDSHPVPSNTHFSGTTINLNDLQ